MITMIAAALFAPDLAPLLTPIRDKHNLPALAGAVVVAGKPTEYAVVGVRVLGETTKAQKGDKFHIGSCTKAMTATMLARLVERTALSWERTIGQAYDGWEMNLQYRNVTLAQLLAHRGGFPPPERSWPEGKSFSEMHALPGTPKEQREAYLRTVLKGAQEYEPGTKYVYSNMGYTVAGGMAERATDKAWEQLMRELIFEPLNMRSAGFGAPGRPEKADQPWGHSVGADGRITAIEPGPLSDNPAVIGPGGTAHASIEDWAKFIRAHLERKTNLLKTEAYDLLHTPAFGGEYAGGWLSVERGWAGGMALTHAGSNTMNYCVAWLAPKKGFAVLVMTNIGGDKAAKACDEVATALIRWHAAK